MSGLVSRKGVVPILLVLLVLSVTAWSQEGADWRRRQVETLLRTSPVRAGAPARHLLRTDGYARYVGASSEAPFAVSGAARSDARSVADAFVAQWRDVFVNPSPATSLEVRRVRKGSVGSSVRYGQTLSGLPVFGAEMMVQVARGGGVVCAIADLMVDTSSLEGRPLEATVSSEKAAKVARKRVAGDYPERVFETTPSELLIFAPEVLGAPGKACLAWRLDVYATDSGRPVREAVFVDATRGAVVFRYPLVHSALNRVVYDLQDTTTAPTTPTRVEGDPASGITDVDQAYDYTGDTYNFYYTEHGRDSFDDMGTTLTSLARYDDDNAYWDDFWEQMIFGTGYAVDDVCAHELTHGVTDHESQLVYAYQSGAINESLSDMWGEWVDLGNGSGTDTPEVRWLLGEDVPGTGAIRDMADPPVFNQPDRMGSSLYYSGGLDNGGVHINSGVGNKLAYLLCDGDTFNGYTVSGMGISRVADLFYECQCDLLTSGADYTDLYVACVQAAINQGWSLGERDNLRNALRAVEMTPMGVDGFTAVSEVGVPVVHLAWSNPAEPGFAGVVIRRATDDYPSSVTEGVAVYVGASTSTTDSGLILGTKYYYSAWADYGDGEYSLASQAAATAGIPARDDWFTEDFATFDFDLTSRTLTLVPAGTTNGYRAYMDPAYAFPTEVTGMFWLSLDDDDYESYSLGSGREVQLYGQSYSSFYVGSNGFITFNEGVPYNSLNLTEYFDLPRVAPMDWDFDPSSGGQIGVRELSDRVMVAWVGVPEYDDTNSSTFQVEMFYNGVIRMTWLEVDAVFAYCGISDGADLPDSFVESDLSAYPPYSAPDLTVSPVTMFEATGYLGQPVADTAIYTIENTGGLPADIAIGSVGDWLTVSTTGTMTLAVGEATSLTLSINSASQALGLGEHWASLLVNNVTSGTTYYRLACLTVIPNPSQMTIYDSVAPVTDQALDLGTVIRSKFSTESLSIANTHAQYPLYIYSIRGIADYYFEDFEDGLAQGWVPGDPLHWLVANRTYVSGVVGSPGYWALSRYSGSKWQDLTVQVTVDREGYDGAAAAIYFRATDDFNPSASSGSAYGVAVSNNGYFWVGKRVEGAFTFLNGSTWGFSSALHTDGTPNTIRACIQGDEIEAYLNGVLVWQGEDSAIPDEGWVVCGCYHSDGGETVHTFDNVLVSRPEMSTAFAPMAFASSTGGVEPAVSGDECVSPVGNDVQPTVAAASGLTALDSVTTLTTDFRLVGLPSSYPYVIATGTSLTMPVVFGPSAAGARRQAVIIESNDATNPTAVVELTGTGVEDPLQVSPVDGLMLYADPSTSGVWADGASSFSLHNTSGASLTWAVSSDQTWLTPDLVGGTLGATTESLSVSVNASGLAEGTHRGLLTFHNQADGTYQTILVTLRVVRPAFASFPLDTNPGWTLGRMWEFGPPQGMAGDPAKAFTGTNVFGTDLSGDGYYDSRETTGTYLVAGPIDCSGRYGVTVSYERWLTAAEYDYIPVFVSTNGTTWTFVHDYPYTGMTDTSWHYEEIDISSIADDVSTVYVKWGLFSNSSVEMGGWNLDDIAFRGYDTALTPTPTITPTPTVTPTVTPTGMATATPTPTATSTPSTTLPGDQAVYVTSDGNFWLYAHNYNTGTSPGSMNGSGTGNLPYVLPSAEWIGFFLYDYTSAVYSEALYVYKE